MKIIKALSSNINVILCGAIGSAVANFFLMDFLSWLGIWIVFIVNSIFSGYLDNFFEYFGMGPTHLLLRNQYVYVASIYLVMFLGITLAANRRLDNLRMKLVTKSEQIDKIDEIDKEETREKLNQSFKNLKKLFVFAFLPFMFLTMLHSFIFIYLVLYVHKNAVFIESSIDIVSPYIDDNERKKLVSKYRRIDQKEKFDALKNELKKITEKKNLILPE